jgi:hypothetical protein
MRTSSVLALVAWTLLLPGALRAGDLTFALDGSAEYDNNVFRSSEDEKQDVVFRLRPWAKLHDDRGQDLRYSLRYAVPVEFAVEHSELDDVDQDLVGDFSYHVNDRLQFFGSDAFRYLRSELRTNVEGTDSAGEGLLINEERERVTLNDAMLGTSYQFTPRLQGTARLEHSYFDPSREDRAQNWSLQGTTDLQYALTPKHSLGGGLLVAHQDFDETRDIVASTSQAYQVFGTWKWAINEITNFSISAGPSLIRVDQDDPSATEMRGIVPFDRVGSFNAPGGFLDRDGNPIAAGTPFPDGSLLVGNINNCELLSDGVTRVLSNGRSCTLTVVLDATPGADDDLIAEIESAANVVTLRHIKNGVVDPNPEGDDSANLNVFAEAVLTRHWTPNLHSALRYVREQGTASGLGGTVVGDSVSLSNTWNMTEKWQFAVRGDWSLRKSVSEATRVLVVAQGVTSPLGGASFTVPIAGVSTGVGTDGALLVQRSDETDIDTMRWGVAGRTTHFFTRNTSGYVQLTYNRQTSASDSLGDPSDFDNFLATIGIQHVFEPIKLW